ncbi:MAG TPA: DUF3418 domain-containing protein, partial [Flavobacteriales bacterium]|nr:DUF3418 domain-containing protein [Flavobacteriales bacterium]
MWAAAPREKLERTGLTGWELDALPEVVTVDVGGRKLQAFPALVDRETAVDVVLLESAAAAREATRAGLRRLYLLGMATTLTKLDGQLPAAIASGPL